MGRLSKSNLLTVLCCLCLNIGVVAVYTIRPSQSITDKDSDYLISNGSVFKLGFFSPLLDLRNLVLKENTIGPILWESFNNPSDTSLPEMKLSTNERTAEKVQLTSWKSPSGPFERSFNGLAHN
uniref:Bulb-type lectin domain-containing protein n=1 Tax=Quercus lobata TaxID=97700 RepID=A0A7N2LSH2_QUELO